MRILIIEDSSAARLLLSKSLKSIIPHADNTHAQNGKNALLLLASEIKYDLIILDLGLPDISGLQVLELTKDLDVKTPIITISDEGNQEALKKSVDIGAVDYLTKPLSRDQLIKVLSEHIKIQSYSKKRNILLVDDDKTNRVIIRRKVEKAGYMIIEASNGFDAIRMTKRHYFDCILMDIRMPFMNGIEASEIIRRDFPDVPILAITAERTEDISQQCMNIGINMILAKPLDMNALVESIDQQIQIKQIKLQDTFQTENIKETNQSSQNEQQFSMFENFLKFVPRTYMENKKLNQPIERGLAKVDDCTIVFVDIRDFTSMTESMSSDECFNFLNSYFELVEPIVQSFGGMVYQFLGDGIICTFPLYKGKHSNNAVHAAISIQDQITIYNRGRKRAGYDPISVGCGVSTGPVATGVCGSNNRYEVGIFGMTMNVAARSQSACRDFGIGITITSDTFDRLENPEGFLIRPIGKHKLKGISQRISLFEVFCHNIPEMRVTKLKSLKYIKERYLQERELPYLELKEKFPEDPIWEKLDSFKSDRELY